MDDPLRDRELRELFRGLKREDEAGAPDFAPMMARIRERASTGEPLVAEATSAVGEAPRAAAPERTPETRRGRRGRWAWAGAALAAAALAGILLRGPGGESDQRFESAVRSFAADPATGGWRSPTDRLLQVPGLDLVRTMPTIRGLREPGATGTAPSMNQL